jgi:dienelactone hydrolase
MSSRHASLAVLALILLAAPLIAADTERGERMIDAYFRAQVRQISDQCLADIKSKDDWEKRRPELRRQFLDMLGLWPLPPRTDLHATVTGKLDADHFTVEKLHFQSSPGLYVTGNLYIPKGLTKPAPAVLYVCGHGNTVIDKVSYGSKVYYQHHPAWFAEHGYVSLVLDTLQLGEIEGKHHGTSRFGMWWWQTLGYTPAGIECWNAMRALDYLETRKEVDMKRVGVTGRSGGGAYSWWITAADERIRCAIPVAGIADLYSHLCEGVITRFRHGLIAGHCDCMYPVNTYRWDFPMVIALCAPRPVLLGNTTDDPIFPAPSCRRLVEKAKRIYDLYGAGDRFDYFQGSHGHVDTPELREAAFRWMNRWLKDDPGDFQDDRKARFTPQQLKVFSRLPDDTLNTMIEEYFIKPAHAELPKSPEVAREWWKGASEAWKQALRERVFHGWPDKAPALNAKAVADVKHDGLRLRAYDFTSEEAIDLRVWLLTHEKTEKPSLVVLNALDEAGWQTLLPELGPAFKDALQLGEAPKLNETKFEQNRRVLEKFHWGFAYVAPRGIGPTRWADDASSEATQIRRRFALIGQTLDGQRVWDVRRALAVLREQPDLKSVPLWLQGKNDMAGIVLYAGLFEPDVARLDLWHPPASHREGPIFLNVRRVLDMPQALALAFPRPVRLYVKDDAEAKAWDWPLQLQQQLGTGEPLKIRKVAD